MKILALNIYADSSVGAGAERTMETLTGALHDAGHTVTIAGTTEGRGIHLNDENDVSLWKVHLRNLYWPRQDLTRPRLARRIWHLIDIYNPLMRAPLESILETEKPDVVIVHNITGWSISAYSAIRRHKVPIVQILHDHYNICANSMMFKNNKNCVGQCVDCRIMRAPHRRLTNQVDAVVGVSQYILDRHLTHGAFRDVKVKAVIHNVRSAETIGLAEAPALRAKAVAERPRDIDVRFGFIGTLAPSKGIEYLLQTFVGLNNARAELLVAGRGKPEYEAMLKQRFSRFNVKFLGQMKPKDFFTAIDVTVVPSLWQENFPGVVAESFAFGVPVIGSRRGGIPEMIIDGYMGLTFDIDAPTGLLSALQYYQEAVRNGSVQNTKIALGAARFLDISEWVNNYMETINKTVNSGRSI